MVIFFVAFSPVLSVTVRVRVCLPVAVNLCVHVAAVPTCDVPSCHLRLEIETLKAPKRIEKIATEQLHLVAPQRGQAIVIERVTPAQPPEKSVVASR